MCRLSTKFPLAWEGGLDNQQVVQLALHPNDQASSDDCASPVSAVALCFVIPLSFEGSSKCAQDLYPAPGWRPACIACFPLKGSNVGGWGKIQSLISNIWYVKHRAQSRAT